MKFKNIIGAVLCACLMCFMPIAQTAAATEPYSIAAPLYELTNDPVCELWIDGTTAYCKTEINNGSAVRITVQQTLEKQGFLWIWRQYDDTYWDKTTYTNKVTLISTKTGLSGGKYRLKSVYTLTNYKGHDEHFTIYSDTVRV